MNIHELKETDPKRFEREYWSWVEHECDYEWWDSVEENFKERMKEFGLDVYKIAFSLSYSQGDYATFEGYIAIDELLEKLYPEQIVLIQEFRDWGREPVEYRRSGTPYINLRWYPGNTYPSGLFKDLDQDAWSALTEQAADDFDLERTVNDWLEAQASELYDDLQKEYEYLTSEEQYIEYCECNDIAFDDEE